MKMLDCLGSMPAARYAAAVVCDACRSSFASCGTVIACRSTTQKKVSAHYHGRFHETLGCCAHEATHPAAQLQVWQHVRAHHSPLARAPSS